MNEILLQNLLNFTDEQVKAAKAKFNVFNTVENPRDAYLRDKELVNTEWLFWQATDKKHDLWPGVIALNFIPLGGDNWLLTTIKKVTQCLHQYGDICYAGDELTDYNQFYGRVIVNFHKKGMATWHRYNTVRNELVVKQILPAIYDGVNFPGYDNVRIPYEQLKLIIDRRKIDWINALSNQKAVYLITDRHTGKMYVGSATSANGMLLARWSSYAANGHGGNVELVKLVEKNGLDYVKSYFTYSILENYNSRVDDSFIKDRESWWKETLLTRAFGYNDN